MSRTCPFLLVFLIAKAAAAQPFLYSLKQTGTCVAGQPCPGPHLLATNIRTGELVNPDDPELFPGTDGAAVGLVASPDGSRLYVGVNPSIRGSSAPGRLVIISTATYRVIGSVVLPAIPFMLLPSPDGTTVYVSSAIPGSVISVDLAQERVTRTMALGGAFAMAISDDGASLVVTSPSTGRVSIVDTATWTARLLAIVSPFPQRAAVTRDGGTIYVSASGLANGAIEAIDAQTGTVTTVASGDWIPNRFLVTPDNSKVYVAFAGGGSFGVLTADGSLAIHTAPVAAGASLVPSQDWRHVYMQGTDRVLAIDTATDTVSVQLPGGTDLTLSAGVCQFTIPPQDAAFAQSGGSGTIGIPAPPGCEWALQSVSSSDMHFNTPTAGTGPALLSYSLPPTSAPREITVRIAGQTVRVSQVVPRLTIDAPVADATIHAPFVIAGWTFEDRVGAAATGIDAVHAWAFPAAGGTPVWLGTPAYGASRPDVGAYFGAAYTQSGFNLLVTWLAPGTYYLAVYGHTPAMGFSASHVVRITVVGERHAMALDLPADVTTLDASSPQLIIGGWAIDRAAAAGTGVDAIHVWAFPVAGGTPRFLGVAPYGFLRPDVGAYYGARCDASGFGAALPKPPPGTYYLAVYAHSSVSGQFDQVRVVQITIAPGP